MAFAARRVRAHAGLLSAVGAVALVLVAGIGALDAAAGRGLDAGVARIVESADPSGQVMRLNAQLAADSATQDTETTALISETFAGLPVTVVRSVSGGANAVLGEAPVRVLLLADPTVASRATLVNGAWPADDNDVAVAEPAADRLRVTTGDPMTIGGADVVVSGVWMARDAADPAWLATPAVASGAAGDDLGPVLGSEEWVAATADAPSVDWVIVPGAPITATTAPGYAAAVTRLAAAAPGLEDSDGVEVSGDLPTTLRRAIAAVAAARGMLVVPVLVTAVIGGIVLGVLIAALTGARGTESRLLRARGASLVGLLAGACLQTGLATAIGAALGAVVALAAGAGAGAGLVAEVALLVLVGTCVLTAVLAARELARSGQERADLDRANVVGMLAPFVLAAVAATLAVVQLYAGGLKATAGGDVDPIPAAAPALALVAFCLLGTLVASPAVAAAARVARRIPGLPPVLALRRLSRQARSVTAGVLSLALAAAVMLFAGSLASSVSRAQTEQVAAVVGADLRAVHDVEQTVDERHKSVDAQMLRGEPGIEAAFPALSRPAALGDEPVSLVAAAADSLAGSSSVTDADAAALASLSAGTIAPLDGSIGVTVTARPSASSSPDAIEVEVAAFTVSADGVGDRILLGTVPADGDPHELRDEVPAASGLLAIELGTTTLPGERIVAVSVTAEGAAGPLELPTPQRVLDASHRSVRIGAVRDLPEALPAVITNTLAATLAIGAGSDLAVDIGSISRPVALRVVGVVTALPGVGRAEGVAVDLPALLARTVQAGSAVLAANEVWVSTDDDASASASIRATAIDRVSIVSPDAVGVDPVTAPAIGLTLAGASGAAALALAAFVIVTASLGRRRRREERPLRSFGFTRAEARRTATIELVSATVVALLIGAAAGAVAAVMLVPALVAAAVP